MTKKQLTNLVAHLQGEIMSYRGTIKNREDRLVEHSDEIARLEKTLDSVELANRELHIKLNLHQNKINHLTSATKSLTAVL